MTGGGLAVGREGGREGGDEGEEGGGRERGGSEEGEVGLGVAEARGVLEEGGPVVGVEGRSAGEAVDFGEEVLVAGVEEGVEGEEGGAEGVAGGGEGEELREGLLEEFGVVDLGGLEEGRGGTREEARRSMPDWRADLKEDESISEGRLERMDSISD